MRRNWKIRGKGRSYSPLSPNSPPPPPPPPTHLFERKCFKAPQWQQGDQENTGAPHLQNITLARNSSELHVYRSHRELPFPRGEELRGRIKFINIFFPYFGVTQRQTIQDSVDLYCQLQHLPATVIQPPKSLLYAILAIKSKYFFPGATVAILFTSSQHCVFLFLRKSSGIWY